MAASPAFPAWDPITQISPLVPPPSTYHELADRYVALYTHNVATHAVEPFVWPWRFLHIYLIVLYFILIPPSWLDSKAAQGSRFRQWRRWICINGRYPVYLGFLLGSLNTIYRCRSPASAVSYAIGLTNMFGIWAFAGFFVFRDARFDALRLEREKITGDGSDAKFGFTNGSASTNGAVVASGRETNGHAGRRKTENRTYAQVVAGKSQDSQVLRPDEKEGDGYRYYWQPLPESFLHRAVWIIDLVTSFRGAGWKHQVRTMATAPDYVLAQLPPDQRPTAKPTCRSYDSISTLLRANFTSIVTAYILWDIFKAVILTDPYFLGFIDSPPPAWVPAPIAASSILVKAIRISLNGTGILLLLRAWFTLSPLVFVGILGPLIRRIPYMDMRATEPWLYSDVFGDPHFLLTHGVAGLWGAWWQQIFRVTFDAPAEALISAMGWKKRSVQARVASMVIAFVISGTFHFAASWTQVGRTKPIMAFWYFPLQGLGIAFEMIAGMVLKNIGVARMVSEERARLFRGAWVFFWIFASAPFFADDMARGGMWLFEPVPISFVRGLGLGGVKGDGWWNWHGAHMWWYTGDRWWKSGIAL